MILGGMLNCSYSQDVSIGPKLGVNFSNLSNAEKAKTLTGLTAGGFFIYSIEEHFGVSADLLYSGEGAMYTTVNTEGNKIISTENKLRLNYIRIPLLANIFFGNLGDQLRPKISLGPSFGILAGVKNSSTVSTTESGTTTVVEYKSTNKNGYSGFDLGAIIGAGLNYKLSEQTWLNLDARYTIGTSDIYDVKPQNSDAVKNNVISVTIGLAFGLSGE